ncbi:hypothetical protein BJ912DRAFT_1070381 [Pholiota molesta]|nr:hypothetical protein BJ912DRAFT_1070381 [Pholiota molesta]
MALDGQDGLKLCRKNLQAVHPSSLRAHEGAVVYRSNFFVCNVAMYLHAAIARKTSILQNAEDDAHAVMEAQIEEITMHLASQTLADKVSGPSVHDPLWSRDVVYPSGSRSLHLPLQARVPLHPLKSPPAKSSPGMHREEELIRVLTDELAPDVKNLLDETVERLKCLETPSSTGPPPPFPLASLLERSTKLCQRLDGVRSKSPAVSRRGKPYFEEIAAYRFQAEEGREELD